MTTLVYPATERKNIPTVTSVQTNLTVSIITPTFNSERTFEDTIRSIRQQQGVQLEYIVVDGGSTDRTIQIARANSDLVMHLTSEQDKGIFDAMNKGIKIASGDIVGILNSDDVYAHPFVLQHVVQKFLTSGVDSVYGDLLITDQKNTNKIVRRWKAGKYWRNSFLFGWMPPHPSFFVKKAVYSEYGLFDLQYCSSADYELMLRFLYKHGISTDYLQEVLVLMRSGGQSSASLKNRLLANKEDCLAWVNNQLKPLFFTTWLKPIRKIPQFRI